LQSKYFAAVDIGTNSFHLIIVEANVGEPFQIVERKREVIRLASHKGNDLSFISDEEVKKAIETLNEFKTIASNYNTELIAIATSAVREVKNQNEFLNSVFEETGIKVEVIDGRREAELIYMGAMKALSLNNNKALCIDIGGGSTEFILCDHGEPIFSERIKIGAVRLSKKFFPDYVITDSSIKNCLDYIEERISSNANINLQEGFDIAVGTSGTILSTAAMIYYSKHEKFTEFLNGISFTFDELKNITGQVLNCKTLSERLFIPGIEIKRADIIPAGMLILNKVFQLFNITEMIISEYALREGIIIDTLDKIKR